MGSALGRSIGAYYAMRRPVVCFIGDQGFQFNVQELQYISMHKLPIVIVLLNNGVSGMIRQKEMSSHKENFLHVSSDTGFASPSMSKLMGSYGITYFDRVDLTHERFVSALKHCTAPLFVDYKIKEDVLLTPTLPHGCLCQDLRPLLASDKYKFLNSL